MIYRNGSFVDRSPQVEPPRAVEGVFSTVGCEGGKPLLWNRHRVRLQNSISSCFPGEAVVVPKENHLVELLGMEGLGRGGARLRVVIWMNDRGEASVEASASRLVGAAGPSRGPVNLEIVHWGIPQDPAHKWVSRKAWTEAQRFAEERGRDDALLIDGAGRVLETSIANVFVRLGSVLITPPAPRLCLPGVMREWVMSAVDVIEREIDLESLLAADEILLTNAVAGVLRVGSVAGKVWQEWPIYDDITLLGVPAPGWS